MSERVREVTGLRKSPVRAGHDLTLEKREGGAFDQSQEREAKMAAGSLAPNSANDIKRVKLTLMGLAAQNWLISNSPRRP
jgi:hypothetical protein